MTWQRRPYSPAACWGRQNFHRERWRGCPSWGCGRRFCGARHLSELGCNAGPQPGKGPDVEVHLAARETRSEISTKRRGLGRRGIEPPRRQSKEDADRASAQTHCCAHSLSPSSSTATYRTFSRAARVPYCGQKEASSSPHSCCRPAPPRAVLAVARSRVTPSGVARAATVVRPPWTRDSANAGMGPSAAGDPSRRPWSGAPGWRARAWRGAGAPPPQ